MPHERRCVYVDAEAYNMLRSYFTSKKTTFSHWLRNKMQSEVERIRKGGHYAKPWREADNKVGTGAGGDSVRGRAVEQIPHTLSDS